MDICESNKAVSEEVRNFMFHVKDAKEESITDYLVWKWRELDKRFNYLSVRTFNHEEESTKTGADFDLELWFVGPKNHISLAVQAKKFIKQHDSYVRKLRYPKNTKKQMDTLLNYAFSTGKLPFYFIYTIPQNTTKTLCGLGDVNGSIYMADARIIEKFTNKGKSKRVSRDDLIAKSNPFHCMFCCPIGGLEDYLSAYFSNNIDENNGRSNEEMPDYVRRVLSSQIDEENPRTPPNNEGWERFKAVGVYDLRDEDA